MAVPLEVLVVWVCAANAAVDLDAGNPPPRGGFRCKARPWALPCGPACRLSQSAPGGLVFVRPKKGTKERLPHGAALRAACAVQIGVPADLSRQSRARPTGLPSPDVRVPASLPAPFGLFLALAAILGGSEGTPPTPSGVPSSDVSVSYGRCQFSATVHAGTLGSPMPRRASQPEAG